jgi:cardiolipin-specific phospholipase
VLKFTGLDVESEIEVKRVPVLDQTAYVSTIIVGDPSKPTLVLTHGYNGSVLLFYKSIKSIAQDFRLVLFDIIGMGTSSRPPFACTDNLQADQFFIEVFEQWRAALDLTGFFLAAHSFGGYLMGTYASLYPQHVKKLLLLSPLGIKQRPENFRLKKMFYPEGFGPPNWVRGISEALWGKVVPASIARKIGAERMVRYGIGKYLNKHQRVPPDEHAALQELMFQMLTHPGSTETAIFLLFDCGLHAHHPLQMEDRLGNPDLPFPISIVYGDADWMDSRGSRQIIRANKFFASGESQLHVLANSGHQFFISNPDGIAELNKNDLLGLITHRFERRVYSIKYVDDANNETYLDEEELQFREELRLKKL